MLKLMKLNMLVFHIICCVLKLKDSGETRFPLLLSQIQLCEGDFEMFMQK